MGQISNGLAIGLDSNHQSKTTKTPRSMTIDDASLHSSSRRIAHHFSKAPSSFTPPTICRHEILLQWSLNRLSTPPDSRSLLEKQFQLKRPSTKKSTRSATSAYPRRPRPLPATSASFLVNSWRHHHSSSTSSPRTPLSPRPLRSAITELSDRSSYPSTWRMYRRRERWSVRRRF